jgi:hypothetical protein
MHDCKSAWLRQQEVAQKLFAANREYVEGSLEASFMRFVAVSPGSWQTYCVLAHLARAKFGLDITPPALPECGLQQGAACSAPARNL